VDYTIVYHSDVVQSEILELPDTLAARYIVLTRRMTVLGPNLGEPHTKAFGDGLFELRLKGAEGIARVFFCTLWGNGLSCRTALSKIRIRRLRANARSPRHA
jgi:phage-related protein